MKGHKVVKDFRYKGRRCVVIKIDRSESMKELPKSMMGAFAPYHNGYVELKKNEIKEDYDEYEIESDEITYEGSLEFPRDLDASDGKTYIGFDSAHYWNDEKPESKTANYVANTCKKIVDEIDGKMRTTPTVKEFTDFYEEEYTKPDSKLETKPSGKEGLRVGTLSDGRKYSVRTSRKRYFFPQEWNKFWNALESDRQRLSYDVLINTGARITEACGIKWSDIDWDKQTIEITRTKIKSAKGESKPVPRTIKIDSFFCSRLVIYQKMFKKSNDDYLGMMSKPYIRTTLKRICKKIGIKDYYNFAPHNIRKTHGNWLKALGIDGLEICNRLGHDQNTFIKSYGSSDVFSKEDKEEIKNIVGDVYE